MKTKINILVLFLLTLPFGLIAQSDYYYYKGEKKHLTIDKDKLEIIADADGYKDFDEVEVVVNPYSLETLVPNPASNQVTVSYKAEDASSAYLMIIGTTNGTSNNYILDTTVFETTIDISNYQFGFYTIALVCDGEIVDAKTLLKN